MRIADVRAFPTSFPVPPEASVTLGIGRAVKRDSVVVKVTTDDGVIGWGESHHGHGARRTATPPSATSLEWPRSATPSVTASRFSWTPTPGTRSPT